MTDARRFNHPIAPARFEQLGGDVASHRIELLVVEAGLVEVASRVDAIKDDEVPAGAVKAAVALAEAVLVQCPAFAVGQAGPADPGRCALG